VGIRKYWFYGALKGDYNGKSNFLYLINLLIDFIFFILFFITLLFGFVLLFILSIFENLGIIKYHGNPEDRPDFP